MILAGAPLLTIALQSILGPDVSVADRVLTIATPEGTTHHRMTDAVISASARQIALHLDGRIA